MARKSGARKEAELFRRIGLSKEGEDLAKKLQEKSQLPAETDVTQEDIDAWYEEKVNLLKGIAEADLIPEMRKFLAFMKLRVNKQR